ncbi:recombinase family protein [Agrobacterium tumefaciens]|uniref:recombinase family protein n=1 Tax=Agrobacterium tumefaciens TaxID=358 RepID=UPI0012B96DEF|nr:recombinase family protein [Agrobacterium tumefaciens]MQB05734.1 recombinase family protein [Agrobacterium tumefaciens]
MTQIHPPVRLIGYARVSTEAQDLAYQIDRLEKAGCVEIFHEKRSGKNRSDRPELAGLLASLQPGDVVLATATDRVARDPLDLVNILKTVKDAGAGLRLLDEPFIDTTSEMADLIAFLVGWAARWQRRRILENTAQGREAARQRGVKFGRPRKLDLIERQRIVDRRAKGEPSAQIARSLGVSESTISRVALTIDRDGKVS